MTIFLLTYLFYMKKSYLIHERRPKKMELLSFGWWWAVMMSRYLQTPDMSKAVLFCWFYFVLLHLVNGPKMPHVYEEPMILTWSWVLPPSAPTTLLMVWMSYKPSGNQCSCSSFKTKPNKKLVYGSNCNFLMYSGRSNMSNIDPDFDSHRPVG